MSVRVRVRPIASQMNDQAACVALVGGVDVGDEGTDWDESEADEVLEEVCMDKGNFDAE